MASFSPLTTWVESYSSSMLWGEIHGGGLGDGGRSSGWDWIFGPILQGGEVDFSVQVSAEPLRTGQLGSGNSSISIQTQGRLKPEVLGRFPIVSWLEERGTSLVLPTSQSLGLGDGGLLAWNDWIFGPFPLEAETHLSVQMSAPTLRKGLGTAETPLIVHTQGNIMPWIGFDPYNTHQTIKNFTDFTNNYLTLTVSYIDGNNYYLVKGTTAHQTGKWYFEFNSYSDFGFGVASSDAVWSTANPWALTTFWHVYNNAGTYTVRNGSNIQTFTGNPAATRRAVAIDLNARHIWFSENGVWILGGNPATGANPTFTNVVGNIYPVTCYSPTTASTLTANFGGSVFVDTPPTGFRGWDEVEYIPIGNSAVSITAEGVLTIPRTLLSGEISISMACEVSFGFSDSLVFAGNIDVEMSLEGDLTVPRTFLGTSNVDILITSSSLLTSQVSFSITTNLDVTLEGLLQGITKLSKLHEAIYEGLNRTRLHSILYGTNVFNKHHTSYSSDRGIAQTVHEISWASSSFTIHEVIYQSVLTNSVQIQHDVLWNSLDGSALANQLHEASWASFGNTNLAKILHTTAYQSAYLTPIWKQHEVSWAYSVGSVVALALHESNYDSFVVIHGYTVHEVTWASSGRLSIALAVHESTWTSSGGAVTAFADHTARYVSLGGSSQVFSLHETGWKVIPDIYALHATSWKSVISATAIHSSRWQSEIDNFRLHEIRYRSNTTTPTIQSGLVYVRV